MSGESLIIYLPWPSADLSPNARVHHMALHRARKAAKTEAWTLTKALMVARGIKPGTWQGPIEVEVTFHPSTNRAYDLDNALSRLKGHLDGIAMALGVNDAAFTFRLIRGAPGSPPHVAVTLTPALVQVPLKGSIGPGPKLSNGTSR